MSRHTDRRVPAPTFLTHHFGRGLVDEGRTFAVDRFRTMSSGDVRRWPLDARTGSNGRARPKPEVATFDEVREMRPASNEIIVCTALGAHCGIQYYGDRACGLAIRRFPLR